VNNDSNFTPAKVLATPYVEKIPETHFTITNKRIDKTISSVTFPGNPGYNTTSEVIFH